MRSVRRLFVGVKEKTDALQGVVRRFRRLHEPAPRVLPDPTRRVSKFTVEEFLTGKKSAPSKPPKASRPVSKSEERMLAQMRASTQIGGSRNGKPQQHRPVPRPTANQVARAKLSHLSNSRADAVMKMSNAQRDQHYR